MTSTFTHDPLGPESGPARKITVTVFYPDAISGSQWIEAIRRVLWELGEGDTLDPRPWRLDILRWPEMQAQALRDIAASAVVIVPADEAYAGSEFFQDWTERWPQAVGGERLLLVTRLGDSPLLDPFLTWLRQLAVKKGMDFADTQALVEKSPGISVHGQTTPSTSTQTQGLAPASETNPRRAGDKTKPSPTLRFWGLNE